MSDTRRDAGEKVTSAFTKHVARHRVVKRVPESSGLNRWRPVHAAARDRNPTSGVHARSLSRLRATL